VRMRRRTRSRYASGHRPCRRRSRGPGAFLDFLSGILTNWAMDRIGTGLHATAAIETPQRHRNSPRIPVCTIRKIPGSARCGSYCAGDRGSTDQGDCLRDSIHKENPLPLNSCNGQVGIHVESRNWLKIQLVWGVFVHARPSCCQSVACVVFSKYQ
jgi:hypothetical protein